MAHQAGEPLDDGEAEPEALAAALALLEAVELEEDVAELAFRDAGAGVPDLDDDVAPAPAAAEEDAAADRVAQGVGEEVLQDAAQQRRVAAHGGGAGHRAERQALGAGEGGELLGERLQDVGEAEVGEARRRHAAVELGDLDELAEQVLDRVERGVDLARPRGPGCARRAPRGTGARPAAAASGRGRRRRGSGSCRGWRARPRPWRRRAPACARRRGPRAPRSPRAAPPRRGSARSRRCRRRRSRRSAAGWSRPRASSRRGGGARRRRAGRGARGR